MGIVVANKDESEEMKMIGRDSTKMIGEVYFVPTVRYCAL